jgi:ATP-dependent RNA helicase RhlE
MLDMGFLPPLKKIIARIPQERQSLCFSATMPREIAELAQTLLRNPHRIDIVPPATASGQVEQQVLEVEQTGKRELLRQVLSAGDMFRVLVFTRTKRRADVVAKQLKQADIDADAIHGDKSQNARTRALERFKNGRTHVLVATDVAARGIDVAGISHVINYDVPHDPESYVHRIGRTGRASAVGRAITFCDPSERAMLRDIERLIGQDLLPRSSRRGEAAGSPTGSRGGARAARTPQGRRPQRVPSSRDDRRGNGAPAHVRATQRPARAAAQRQEVAPSGEFGVGVEQTRAPAEQQGGQRHGGQQQARRRRNRRPALAR